MKGIFVAIKNVTFKYGTLDEGKIIKKINNFTIYRSKCCIMEEERTELSIGPCSFDNYFRPATQEEYDAFWRNEQTLKTE